MSTETSTAIAPGATLFILDDEGILYSERRGELETLDSAAAFVWCCLEEGHAPKDIVCDLAEAFGLPMAAAQDRVDTLIRKWGDRGDISVDANAHGCLHLTTALGRLLADEELRRAFAASPRELADTLRIRSADRDTFLALDPAALERQAQLLTAKREFDVRKSRQLEPIAAPFSADAEGVCPAGKARGYRLLDCRIELRFATPEIEAAIAPRLAHLEVGPDDRPARTVSVYRAKGGFFVADDSGRVIDSCRRLEELAVTVESELKRMALAKTDYLFQLNATLVETESGIVAVFGDNGAADILAHRGTGSRIARYLGLSPLVDSGGVTLRPVRLLPPPGEDRSISDGPGPDLAESSERVTCQRICFASGPWDDAQEWLPISRADALHRLMKGLVRFPGDIDRAAIAHLVAWLRTLACFRIGAVSGIEPSRANGESSLAQGHGSAVETIPSDMNPPSLVPAQSSWRRYYDAVAGLSPSPTTVMAIDLWTQEHEAPGSAVDLGCGDGRDTLEFLRRGWRVLAIDTEPTALDLLVSRPDLPSTGRVDCRCLAMEDATWGAADIVNASFALPFCRPDRFDALWRQICASLPAGGRFAGHFFGPEDSWANERLTITDREDVDDLLSSFEIEYFCELKEDGRDAVGNAKHWHLFHVVARKR